MGSLPYQPRGMTRWRALTASPMGKERRRMTIALTAQLGAFVAALTPRALPEAAREQARIGFTDTIACLVAGRNEPPVEILRQVLNPLGDESTLLLARDRGRAQALDAAMINGTAAHVLDYDDAALKGHPSVILVTAILAEAEAIGATGEQMVTAYVAGYETWGELVRRDLGQHHLKGLHPSGIFGTVGAAAACASLRGLDARQAATAIGLGASHSAGLAANFGSMAKPYHCGRAAQAGIMAARLAQAGMTASPDVLEHPRGFLFAYSPKGEIDYDTPLHAGRDWSILSMGLSLKKYPMCYCAHRPLDAMLDLLKARPVAAEEVEAVTVEMSARNYSVLRNRRPTTGLAAKFSIEFAMASAIVAGRCGLPEVQDSFVQRDDVQALIERVGTRFDPREDPFTGYAPFDRVTIRTRAGAEHVSEPVTMARGAFEVPLTRDEIFTKFEGCLIAGHWQGEPEALFAATMTIDHLPGTAALPLG